MIVKIINWIRDVYYSNKNTCCFVGFDVKRKEAVFRLKMKSSVFKVALMDAIQDAKLIYTLTAVEACWLGGYYGRYLRAVMDGKITSFGQVALGAPIKSNSNAQYHMLSFNRDNELTYLDCIEKKIQRRHVCEIAYRQEIIACFDNSQACYIGFLAGTLFEKRCNANKKWMRPLRLVTS